MRSNVDDDECLPVQVMLQQAVMLESDVASDAEHAQCSCHSLPLYFSMPVNSNVAGRMSALSTSHTSK
jgi:hypothetical protein